MHPPGPPARRPSRARGALVAALAIACLLPAFGEESMVEPRFREGRPGDVLVRGEPSLLRGHLDAFVDLTEASFALAWAAPVEQELRDALELSFGRWGPAERGELIALVTPLTGLRERGRAGDLEGLKAGLRAFWIALDARISAAPREKAHQLLTQGLERRQRAVWRGIPAIHGSAADAWLEATLFLSTLGRNERFEPTAGQRASLLEALDLGLHGQSEAVRERLRDVHRTWLLAKARWDAADGARRFALRFEAVRLLARLLPPGRALTIVPGPDLTDYAREAARVQAAVEAYDAWSSAVHSPEASLEALTKGLDLLRGAPAHVLLYR